MAYASYRAGEVRYRTFDMQGDYLLFNGKKIVNTGLDYFDIEWKDKTIRRIRIKNAPPFKKDDVSALKLRKEGEYFVLEEYHIWESKSQWYLKAMASAIPMFIVFALVLKNFRFDFSRLMFVRRESA